MSEVSPILHEPWPSFERFYQLAGAHQTLGYLGILASPPSQPLAQRLARKLNERPLSGVRVQSAWSDALGGLLLDVHVNVGDAQQRATTWQQVTRRVRQVVAND